MEGAALDEAVLEAIPRVAGVRVGRFSGPVDTDGVKGPDAIEVYVEPFDGRRRFVQVAGRLTVEVTFLAPLEPGAPPAAESGAPAPAPPLDPADRLVMKLGPGELREAFRSDLLGFRYTVRVPLPRPNEELRRPALVRIELLDALSGQIHRDERLVQPSTGRPAASTATR